MKLESSKKAKSILSNGVVSLELYLSFYWLIFMLHFKV